MFSPTNAVFFMHPRGLCSYCLSNRRERIWFTFPLYGVIILSTIRTGSAPKPPFFQPPQRRIPPIRAPICKAPPQIGSAESALPTPARPSGNVQRRGTRSNRKGGKNEHDRFRKRTNTETKDRKGAPTSPSARGRAIRCSSAPTAPVSRCSIS